MLTDKVTVGNMQTLGAGVITHKRKIHTDFQYCGHGDLWLTPAGALYLYANGHLVRQELDILDADEREEVETFWRCFPPTGRKNPAWVRWATQVNVNYHDGGMSETEAERVAGPEPDMYLEEKMAMEDEYWTQHDNSIYGQV